MVDNNYEVGLEEVESNHWAAFVFALPGCFSSGRTPDEAVSGVNDAIEAYDWWLLRGHEPHLGEFVQQVEPNLQVVEVIPAYWSAEDPHYLINAFFQDDARPLSLQDIQYATHLLAYTREDLLAVVKDLSPEALYQPIPGEKFGSIAGILLHVAGAEQWYCDRLGLGESGLNLPDDPFKALEISRANTILALPELGGNDHITERIGERWSARKILRRTLWHERDHTEHIRKLISSP